MSISRVGSGVLPVAVSEALLRLGEQMWAAACDGARSPAEAEEQVAALSRLVGREVLSAGLSERYGRHEGGRHCQCGAAERLEGYRGRTITTTLGPVRYLRAYYRCAACGQCRHQGDAALGIADSKYSLPAQEALSLTCSEVPFERARILLERLCGLECCVSQAEAISQVHGLRILEQHEREREQLFAGELELVPEQRDHRLYVAFDATKTRFRDDWHETKVAAFYDALPGRDGVDLPQRTTYLALAQPRLEVFGQALWQEAARRGVEHAREVVVVADGAPWIWNLAAEHFPRATQILDFYHASERLHAVSHAVYGTSGKQARRWADRNVAGLLAGRWKSLLCSLKALRPTTGEGREAVRLAVGYFETNRQRMDYPSYRARGLHIGSGVVEAACKCVVNTRCKRAGMRWTQTGAQAILSLRALLLNNRWDQHWQPLKAVA
jgi:hypothetical protein